MSQEEKVDLIKKASPKRDDNAEIDEEDEEEEKKLEEKRLRKEAAQKRREELRKKAEERKRKEKPQKEEEEDEDEISTSTPKSTAKKVAIREDIVNSCVNFLNHPKVKPSPLSQKIAFLQKKGLTQEEIQEAINRANGASSTPTTLSPPSPQIVPSVPPQQYPPIVYQQPLPPPPPVWYGGRLGFLLTAISCVGVGVGITLLANKYFLRNEEVERKKEEEKKADTQKLAAEVTSTLKEMQTQNGELKDLLKGFLTQSTNTSQQNNGFKGPSTFSTSSPSSTTEQKIEIAELKSEIKKLKAIMLDNKSNPSTIFSSSSSSSPSPSTTKDWSPSSDTKLPTWMQKDSGKNPLSFDDSYNKILEKAQSRGTTGEGSSTTSLEEEPRPKDFGRIIQMVQNGQIPDDVKQINDKPLDPYSKIEKGQRQAPLKPWQKPSSSPSSSTILSETIITESSLDETPRVQEILDEKENKGTNGELHVESKKEIST